MTGIANVPGKPRHLLFLTGTRADFGRLEPLAAAARDAGHRVTFFVTGMHMMDRYGLTRNEVRLQLHALAYNLATFLSCIELPQAMAD
jgi:UDP-N-acetylglucosamine 2-epimerase